MANVELSAVLTSRLDDAGFRELDTRLDSASTRLDAFGRLDVTPSITLDTKEFDASLKKAEDRLGDWDESSVSVLIEADLREFNKSLDAVEERLDRLDSKTFKARLDIDVQAASTALRSFETDVAGMASRISSLNPMLKLSADTRDAQATISAFEGSVRGVSDRINTMRPTLTMQANTDQAMSSVQAFEGFVRGTSDRISAMQPTLLMQTNTEQATSQIAAFENFVRATAERISALRPVLEVDANADRANASIGGLENFVRGAAERIRGTWSSLNGIDANLRVRADGLDEIDRNVSRTGDRLNTTFNRRYNLDIDSRSARALGPLMGDLASSLQRWSIIAAGVAVTAVQVLDARLAGMASSSAIAAAGIGGLVQTLGTALVGAAGAGAAALVGMGSSVMATRSVLTVAADMANNTGKAFGSMATEVKRSGEEVKGAKVLQENLANSMEGSRVAADRLSEAQSRSALATQYTIDWWEKYGDAANDLTNTWGLFRLELARITSDVGGRLLPVMTNFVEMMSRQLPFVKTGLLALADGVETASERFHTFFQNSDAMRRMQEIIIGIGYAAGPSLEILSNGLMVALNVFGPLMRHGMDLIWVLQDMSDGARRWSESNEGQEKIAEFWANAVQKGKELIDIISNLGTGLSNVFEALGDSGVSDTMWGGLQSLAQGFADVTTKGTESREMLDDFLRDANPILEAMGSLGKTAAHEFFSLAYAVSQVTNPETGGNALVEIFGALEEVVPMVGAMLLHTFEKLAPVLPDLIVEVGRFVTFFQSITPQLVVFLEMVTAILGFINDMPGPVKIAAAAFLGLGAAIGALGGTGAGGIASMIVSWLRYRSTLGAIAESHDKLTDSIKRGMPTQDEESRKKRGMAGDFDMAGGAMRRMGGNARAADVDLGRLSRTSDGVRSRIGAIPASVGPAAASMDGLNRRSRDAAGGIGALDRNSRNLRTRFSGLPALITPTGAALGGFDRSARNASVGAGGLDRNTRNLRSRFAGIGAALINPASVALGGFGRNARTASGGAGVLDRGMRNLRTRFAGLAGLINPAGASLGGFGRNARSAATDTRNMDTGARNLRSRFGGFSALANPAGASLGLFGRNARGANTDTRNMDTGVRNLRSRFNGLSALVNPAGASLGLFGRHARDSSRGMEEADGSARRLRTGLGGISGNARAAGTGLDDLDGTSRRAAKGKDEAEGSARRLGGSLQGVGRGGRSASLGISPLEIGAAAVGLALLGAYNHSDKFRGSVDNFASSAAPAGSRAMKGFGDAMAPIIDQYGPHLVTALEKIADFTETTLPAGINWSIETFGLLGTALDTVALDSDATTGEMRSAWSDVAQQIAGDNGPKIIEGLGLLGDALGATALDSGASTEEIRSSWSDLYAALVGNSIVPDMVNGITSWFSSMASSIISVMGTIKSAAIDAWAYVKKVVVGESIVPDMVKDVVKWHHFMEKDVGDSTKRLETAIVDPIERGTKRAQDSVRGLAGLARNIPTQADGPPPPAAAAARAEAQAPARGPAAPAIAPRDADPLKPLADNSTRHLDTLTKRTEDAGKTIQDTLAKSLTQTTTASVKQFDDLQKGGVKHMTTLREDTGREAERMRTRNVTLFTQYQQQGTRQTEILRNNANVTHDVMARQTGATMNAMRTRNVSTVQDMQRRNTQQFQTLQRNGTQQMQTLQKNGTTEAETLQKNAVAAMQTTQTGIVDALTGAQTGGNEQLSSLRSGGAATMQAADPEWRGPVGKAAEGVQNYLNDMLYGMAAVIDAAKLTIAKPGQFTPRLTGNARGGIYGMPGLRRFAGGGIGSMDMGEEYNLKPGEHAKDPGSMAGRLYQSGYRGNPNDGKDALYAPGSTMNPVYGPGHASGTTAPSGGGSYSAAVPISFTMSGFAAGGQGGEGEEADWGAMMAFLKQGKVKFDDQGGGVAGPGETFLHWWGEGAGGNAREAFIPDDQPRNRMLPILEQAAQWYDAIVIPRESVSMHGEEKADRPSGFRRFERGGLPTLRGFQYGYTMYEDMWTPRQAQMSRQTEAATGTAANTYSNHPPGYEERAPYSTDHWGPAGRDAGDHISVGAGDAVVSYILANFASELSYWIWNGADSYDGSIAAAEPHTDHVHWTAMPGLNMMSGGGGGNMRLPNVRPLIAEHFPPEATTFGGQGIPDQAAVEIGQIVRKAMIEELMRHQAPGPNGGGPGGAFSGGGDQGSNRELGRRMNAAMGWDSQWESLDYLWTQESGWDHLAQNPSSGAYGIPQALPGEKMAESGADWQSNPATQIDWGLGYIAGRYPSGPAEAWGFHQSSGWYDNGGIALGPQNARINGPELMLPLHDPMAAARFLDIVETAQAQRPVRTGVTDQAAYDANRASAPRLAEDAAMRVFRQKLDEHMVELQRIRRLAEEQKALAEKQAELQRETTRAVREGPTSGGGSGGGYGGDMSNSYTDERGNRISLNRSRTVSNMQPTTSETWYRNINGEITQGSTRNGQPTGGGSGGGGGSYGGGGGMQPTGGYGGGGGGGGGQSGGQSGTIRHYTNEPYQYQPNIQNFGSGGSNRDIRTGEDNRTITIVGNGIKMTNNELEKLNRQMGTLRDENKNNSRQLGNQFDQGTNKLGNQFDRGTQGLDRSINDGTKTNREMLRNLRDEYQNASRSLKDEYRDRTKDLREMIRNSSGDMRDKLRDELKQVRSDYRDQMKDLRNDYRDARREAKEGSDRIVANVEPLKSGIEGSHVRLGDLLSTTRKVWGLAEGGRITKPTPAIVGEDGEEFVIPVDPRRKQRGLDVLHQAAKELNVRVIDDEIARPGMPRGPGGGHRHAFDPRDPRDSRTLQGAKMGKRYADGNNPPSGAGYLGWDLVGPGGIARYNINSSWDAQIRHGMETLMGISAAKFLPNYGGNYDAVITDGYADGSAGITRSNGTVELNVGAMAGASAGQKQTLINHELLHGLGLDHTYGIDSLMDYGTMYNFDGVPTAYDRSTTAGAWGAPSGYVPKLPGSGSFTNGGIATKPQMASVAERGPELFIPLHDPESSRRFMRVLQDAVTEPGEDSRRPGAPPPRSSRAASESAIEGEISKAIKELRKANAEDREKLVQEIVALREEVTDLAPRVGSAVVTGTVDRLENSPEYNDAMEGSLKSSLKRRDFAGDLDWTR